MLDMELWAMVFAHVGLALIWSLFVILWSLLEQECLWAASNACRLNFLPWWTVPWTLCSVKYLLPSVLKQYSKDLLTPVYTYLHSHLLWNHKIGFSPFPHFGKLHPLTYVCCTGLLEFNYFSFSFFSFSFSFFLAKITVSIFYRETIN